MHVTAADTNHIIWQLTALNCCQARQLYVFLWYLLFIYWLVACLVGFGPKFL